MKTILITGAEGFTGRYLVEFLKLKGLQVLKANCDLTKQDEVFSIVSEISSQNRIDWVIHLAAKSFVAELDNRGFYDVNVLGTENLLKALAAIENKPNVILASSANIYGTPPLVSVIDETVCPSPVNHYACSKLSMEHIAKQYMQQLQIVVTRPFNYTGVGQSLEFVIPKIVNHFQQGQQILELGNINVARDFSSIDDVVESYWHIMNANIKKISGQTINICSGKATSLTQVIEMLEHIAGYSIKVKVNPKFVRANEISSLCGSNNKLFKLTGYKPNQNSLKAILKKMYQS